MTTLYFQNAWSGADRTDLANYSFDYDGLLPASGPYRAIRFLGITKEGGVTPRNSQTRYYDQLGNQYPQGTVGPLTSNTAPVPLVASSGVAAAADAWTAFSNNTADDFHFDNVNADPDNHLTLDLGSNIADWEHIRKVVFNGSSASRTFTTWEIQVSIDAVNFLPIYRVAGQSAWPGGGTSQTREWPFVPALLDGAALLLFPGGGSYGKTRGMGLGIGLGLGKVGKVLTGGPGVPAVLHGSVIAGDVPTNVYGTMRLVDGYAGKLFRMRRGSDNAERDIGQALDARGRAVADPAAIKTFCGASDGYVVTMYNQGSGGHATQTNTSLQPRLFDGATQDYHLKTPNGMGCLWSEGGLRYFPTAAGGDYNTTDRALFVVHTNLVSRGNRAVIRSSDEKIGISTGTYGGKTGIGYSRSLRNINKYVTEVPVGTHSVSAMRIQSHATYPSRWRNTYGGGLFVGAAETGQGSGCQYMDAGGISPMDGYTAGVLCFDSAVPRLITDAGMDGVYAAFTPLIGVT